MKADSEKLKSTMEFYCQLMQEIKIRDTGIGLLINSPTIASQIAYESSYLQLRMICEVIAVSCLLIHGDIPDTPKKIRSTWKADEIIKRLSEMHPDFYPHPVKPLSSNKFKIEVVASGFLTRSDLLSLYGKSGDKLHRGTMENVRHRFDPANVTFVRVQGWRDKIVHLLDHHWIKMHDSDDEIGVQMGLLNASPTWNYWARQEIAPDSRK